MTALSDLPDGWDVWSQEDDGRVVLAYRPDVFDGDNFPPACMPTLYLTHGQRSRRPGSNPNDRTVDDDWYVTLSLEPEVRVDDERFATRDEALDQLRELARRFDDGQIDYRDAYQVPREAYLERLDELAGRVPESE